MGKKNTGGGLLIEGLHNLDFYFAIVKPMEEGEKVKHYLNPMTEPATDVLVVELFIKGLTKEAIDNILKAGRIRLTKEEVEELIEDKNYKFINRYFSSKRLTKFKVAGHLKDQQLKYTYPKDKSTQLSIWDSLTDQTKNKIKPESEVVSIDTKELVEGIRLSPSETKVIDVLCKLLQKNSQTLNPNKEDYYSGNLSTSLVSYGGEETTAPKLGFSLYELTKEYKGGESIGGKDVENVKKILQELDNRRFLLSYIETFNRKDGGRIERKIEDFRKLITILKLSQTEYNKDNLELSKTEETVILLNPIFRRQIDSKFILYPEDIARRTIIAYGSHNISETTLRLRDYLIREFSSKHYNPDIYLDRLYYLLNEKWMKESRKKKVKEFTDKALETCIALGLLLKYEIVEGVTGEPKIIFTLNKKWE